MQVTEPETQSEQRFRQAGTDLRYPATGSDHLLADTVGRGLPLTSADGPSALASLFLEDRPELRTVRKP